jgi:hypothetical protein
MLQRMSRHMGIEQKVSDAEATELAEATAVENLAANSTTSSRPTSRDGGNVRACGAGEARAGG